MAWSRAVMWSLGVVAVAYLALAVVPDYLVSWLSGRVGPVLRDLAVGGWALLSVVGATWLLVRAQGRERVR